MDQIPQSIRLFQQNFVSRITLTAVKNARHILTWCRVSTRFRKQGGEGQATASALLSLIDPSLREEKLNCQGVFPEQLLKNKIPRRVWRGCFLAEVLFVIRFGGLSQFLSGGESFAVQAVLGYQHQLYLLDSLLRKRYSRVFFPTPRDF